jgi:hypothetical protein
VVDLSVNIANDTERRDHVSLQSFASRNGRRAGVVRYDAKRRCPHGLVGHPL